MLHENVPLRTEICHLRRKWLGLNVPIDDEDFEQQLEQVVESTMPRGQQLNFCEVCINYNSE